LVSAFGVNFAIGRTFALDASLSQDHDVLDGRSFAVGRSHAHALIVSQVSFGAEATDDAIPGAHWARMWVGAGGWASGAAGLVDFVLAASWNWREHHERFWLNLGRAIAGFNAFVGFVAEMALFASAAWDADARADWVRVLAGTITTFALTVFFILFAFGDWREHHKRFWLNLDGAFAGFNAFASFVAEMTLFASAAWDADARADWVGVLAGTIATFALTVFFVFFALHFWWVGEEHVWLFNSLAFAGLNAETETVSQKSFLAEASDDTVLGADRAWVGVGASGCAGRTAWIEHFVIRALRSGLGFLEWQTRHMGVAFLRAHAIATGVLHEAFCTETASHTHHWACFWWVIAGGAGDGT